MQKKKYKKRLPPTDEELELKDAIKELQKKKRILRRQMDDIDTEMIEFKERLLSLKEIRERKERQL